MLIGAPAAHEVLRATNGAMIRETFWTMTILGAVPGSRKDTLTAFIQKVMMLIIRVNEGELSWKGGRDDCRCQQGANCEGIRAGV